MDYRREKYVLSRGYDLLEQGNPIRARQSIIPVVELLNQQLLDATRNARSFRPAYREVYLDSSCFLQVLVSQCFEATSLDSVTVIGWNKRFEDNSDYRTLVGTLVREGKQYGNRDMKANRRAAKSLATLVTIVGRRLTDPKTRSLIVSPPSSQNSTNTLPRLVISLVAEASPNRFELAPTKSIGRVKEIGQMKAIPEVHDRLNLVRDSASAVPAIFAGRRVLLLDDVLETGGTLREAARAIKSAGAIEVHALAMETTRRFALNVMGARCP